MPVYNFSAGPAVLPQAVLEKARNELLDYRGSGVSVMEMSHRGKEFTDIAARAEAGLRELLGISDDYAVLFLQGGATLQFAMVPLNLCEAGETIGIVNTGHWSKKAIDEMQRFANVDVVASSEDSNFAHVPAQEHWSDTRGMAAVHVTPNETIGGVEYGFVPDVSSPLVADMSSTILSRPVDVSNFDLIYAGAQKNIGPAGLTIAIVRRDLLDRARASAPSLMRYASYASSGSMINTPPTFAWYMAGLVFDWIKEQGGLTAMASRNEAKAKALYGAIDNSDGFYANPVRKDCRSWMNVPFTLHDDSLDSVFIEEAGDAQLVQLKGHRSVGGMRASIYNAMPPEGVNALVEFMGDFSRRHG